MQNKNINSDATVIYYTANLIPEYFMHNVQKQILKAVGNIPIISVSQKPIDFGHNICVGNIGQSAYNIYKQILIGVREAKTDYVFMCEDDVMYPAEHFTYRPTYPSIAYDINKWCVFTWDKNPIYSQRSGRRTMTSMIGNRQTLLDTLEERYAKYPTVESIPPNIYEFYFGEPGRFESHLGISTVSTVKYFCPVPHVQFSTPEAFGFKHLGKRKAHGNIRVESLYPWGTAREILKNYAI